jgi:hypothetical protein
MGGHGGLDDEDLGHVVLPVPCEEDRGECVNVFDVVLGLEPGNFPYSPSRVYGTSQ